jgi:hypothetical protein
VLGSMFVGILACSFTFDLFFYQHASLIFFIVFGLLWCNFTVSSTSGQNQATGRIPYGGSPR